MVSDSEQSATRRGVKGAGAEELKTRGTCTDSVRHMITMKTVIKPAKLMIVAKI